MNRRKIILYTICSIAVFVLLIFYPFNKGVNYFPKIIDKSSIIKIEINYYNILGFRIPFKAKNLELFYDQLADSTRLLNPSTEMNFTEKKSFNSRYIVINESGRKTELSFTILRKDDDSDDDGFPDSMELTDEIDRTNFRKWFCAIALTQFYKIDDKWIDRDCAGFIRFCTREALKKHDNKWLANKKLLYDINIPDVKKYNYPDVPFTGEKLFRIKPVAQDNSQLLNDTLNFASFAEARFLLSYNYEFISKDIQDALPGDVLFFSNDLDRNWPYHSMIFLGDEMISDKNHGDFVIYHTGNDGNTEGIIKKLRLSDLKKHPVKRWHPIKSNPFFLGFYRWKLLN